MPDHYGTREMGCKFTILVIINRVLLPKYQVWCLRIEPERSHKKARNAGLVRSSLADLPVSKFRSRYVATR
ncbi:hypothetical protein, partial [Klebsiella pneumoniae]|uniref:hypothetical protein n=1 Tax=Klebsiella pneumoniae TaxID=573 RepID=UPI001C6FB5CA